jgi:transglutaminase superfamily protein
LLSRVRKFITLPRADRALLMSAIVAIVEARMTVTFVSVRKILDPVAPRIDAKFTDADTSRISWAVETAGRVVPSGKNCLVRAIAGRDMLARRGIGSQIRLGIAKNSADVLSGHAWLECGDRIITGEGEHLGYSPMPVGS